jgi:hypothetical protein
MPGQLKKLGPYAILLLILLVAYLPVSTFYFGMKNDAFSDNFPHKFFLSEAIHSGNSPLWNPYMNFGFALYADVGFAFYTPITWLFALLGYNAYTLTAEVLLYIYLGGVFMYRLGRYLGFTLSVSLAIAAMYMCSGFYTGGLTFINFLTAAAFLPLTVQMVLQLIHQPCLKNSFLLAVACFFVFAGGHPYIPIILPYFIAALAAALFIFHKTYRQNAKQIIIYALASLGCFLLLYLPALYSYLNIIPFYGRNYIPNQALNTGQGFTLSAYTSFLFPFYTATTHNIFGADVTMRNGYFSIAGFICALLAFKNKQLYARVFTIAAVFMLVLSMGGPFKAFLYSKLPLLGFVCHNGEFRIFSILCFSITAGFGLQQLQGGDAAFKQRLTWALRLVAIAALLIFAAAIVSRYNVLTGFFAQVKQNSGITQKVKAFLQGPTVIFLLVSALLTLTVCLLSLYAIQLKKRWFTVFVIVILGDLSLNSILYLPVTGVGQTTLPQIQAVYNTSPKGIIIPPLIPVNQVDTLDEITTGLVGNITYYNKHIGTVSLTDYPSYFTTTNDYFNNAPLVAQVSKQPYLFLASNSQHPQQSNIVVNHFAPGNIEVQVTALQDDTLVYLQNNYKFWHGVANKQPVPVVTMYGTFMGVKINKGVNTVLFYYRDVWLVACLLVSALFFITGFGIIGWQKLKGTPPGRNR